jgi:hypothetical protein
VKYFICALEGTPFTERKEVTTAGTLPGNVHLGIPAERTERIISMTRIQTAIYVIENQEAFISLPCLFRLKDVLAPHGIILKTDKSDIPINKSSDISIDKHIKTILLTPKIDIELEIPEESIHRMPESFAGLFRCFKGAYFTAAGTGQSVILLLDPEKIVESIHNDQYAHC